ncbi:MAG: hypothetical protein ACP5HG_06240 [Anaerolineae bacterium]
MAEIRIKVAEKPGHYACSVTVTEGRSTTEHEVTVKKEDYQRLTLGEVSVKQLVDESFRFLLERESNTSILRSFDLMAISRYFPEYEREIKERLS